MSNSTDKNSPDTLNIVSFIGRDWGSFHGRPHYIAMSKYARVLCVELPISLASPFMYPRKFREWLSGRRGLRQLFPNLFLYTPMAPVPYALSYRNRFLRLLNRASISFSLRAALRRLKIHDFVQIVTFPQQECVLGIGNPRLQCYEVSDEFTANIKSSDRLIGILAGTEENILKSVDMVFAASEQLFEKKKPFNPHTYCVPAAADVEHFGKALAPDTQIPSDIAGIKRPLVGFVGNINIHATDMGLINHLALTHPDWSIVMIGAVNGDQEFVDSPQFKRSKTLANVHYLGWKNYETLPAYMKALDVCLGPWAKDEWMKYASPNKFFQYLAAGKPVVSTDVPSVRSLAQVIMIASDKESFVKQVEQALVQNTPDQVARRLEVAKENSADVRAQQKLALIRERITGRKGL